MADYVDIRVEDLLDHVVLLQSRDVLDGDLGHCVGGGHFQTVVYEILADVALVHEPSSEVGLWQGHECRVVLHFFARAD